MFQSAPFGTVKRWIPGLSGYSRPEELEQLKIAPKPPPTLFSTVLRNQETVSDNFQHAQSLVLLLFKNFELGFLDRTHVDLWPLQWEGASSGGSKIQNYRVFMDFVRLDLLDRAPRGVRKPTKKYFL